MSTHDADHERAGAPGAVPATAPREPSDPGAAVRPRLSERGFVFGDDRPFASCHAATVLPLADGRIMTAWFAGSYESHPDVAIWGSVRGADRRWAPPVKLADEAALPHWNPVLGRSPSGRLVLFYKVGPECMSWHTRVIALEGGTDPGDEDATWSEPGELPLLGGFTAGPVKNKPIVLSDGAWLAPTSRETETEWDAAVTVSRDDGATWELAGTVPLDHETFEGKGVIQPSVWESASGTLHMLLRSTAGRIYRADSEDTGRTWSPAYPTELPNNNSGIDLARLPDGTLAFCHNSVPTSWGKRTPLVVSFSRDNGATWGDELVLEDEELSEAEEQSVRTRAFRPNEFSYPAIVAEGSMLHVAYTWKRARICYRTIAPVQKSMGENA